MGEIVGGFGDPLALDVLARGRQDERDRPQRAGDEARAERAGVPRHAHAEVVTFVDQIDGPILEGDVDDDLREAAAELSEHIRHPL